MHTKHIDTHIMHIYIKRHKNKYQSVYHLYVHICNMK